MASPTAPLPSPPLPAPTAGPKPRARRLPVQFGPHIHSWVCAPPQQYCCFTAFRVTNTPITPALTLVADELQVVVQVAQRVRARVAAVVVVLAVVQLPLPAHVALRRRLLALEAVVHVAAGAVLDRVPRVAVLALLAPGRVVLALVLVALDGDCGAGEDAAEVLVVHARQREVVVVVVHLVRHRREVVVEDLGLGLVVEGAADPQRVAVALRLACELCVMGHRPEGYRYYKVWTPTRVVFGPGVVLAAKAAPRQPPAPFTTRMPPAALRPLPSPPAPCP